MRWGLVLEQWEAFAWGVWITVHLTFLAVVIGFFLALPGALAQVRRRWWAPLPRAYVYLFRGTPLIVQTYLIYYGLGQFETVRESVAWPVLREAWWCALIAFALNSGAYQTEILRGAIATTPKGEIEAATALGLSRRQVLWLTTLPSALRRAMPQYANEIVFMLHGSAIASVITIQDILGVGRWLNAKYYLSYEGLLSAALLYMCITFGLVFLFRAAERRFLAHLRPPDARTARREGIEPHAGDLVAER